MDLLQRYSNQAPAWAELARVQQTLARGEVRSEPESVVLPKRHRIKQRFDPETRARLVAEYEAGATGIQLMRDFGIGKGTVLQILRDAGVTLRQQGLSPADRKAAIKLYQSGLSLQKVAEQFGVSANTVMLALRQAGVPLRPRPGWKYEA